ncbi:30S ribosomal protein S6e [Candidatus Bathyarchaeota archaeon]|nr:30S ribosomal protein S6e [Candidatus Bathyarchaeota archaeon]
MAKFKLVISDTETGKSKSLEIEGSAAQPLVGQKIGDTIDGAIAKMRGAKLKITGGSDKDGTPLKPNVYGEVRASIMLSRGVGFHPKQKGERRRKMVRGNVITDDIFQINLKILEKPKKKSRKKTKKLLKKPSDKSSIQKE